MEFVARNYMSLMRACGQEGKVDQAWLARVDLDTLFTDYTAIYFRFSSNLLCGLYPIELWAGDIIGVNVVVNENDMQIIADIVYNDVNIQLLFSGYGLFLALVNVFGFYLIMVSQDRSA